MFQNHGCIQAKATWEPKGKAGYWEIHDATLWRFWFKLLGTDWSFLNGLKMDLWIMSFSFEVINNSLTSHFYSGSHARTSSVKQIHELSTSSAKNATPWRRDQQAAHLMFSACSMQSGDGPPWEAIIEALKANRRTPRGDNRKQKVRLGGRLNTQQQL